MKKIIEWKTNSNPKFSERRILIPATSVKGAISHRTAFHYNKEEKIYADNLPEDKSINDFVGNHNKAVQKLFGYTLKGNNKQESERGNTIFSDVFLEVKNEPKILNHVAIDRFTGGAIDGALFDEKVIDQKDKIKLEILVDNNVFNDKPRGDKIQKAFESALMDICKGMLPLGGGVMRGHGVFTGNLIKNNKEIFSYGK